MTRRSILLALAGLTAGGTSLAASPSDAPQAITHAVLGHACFSPGQTPLPPFLLTLSAPVPWRSRIVVSVMRWDSLAPTVVSDTQGNVYSRDYAAGLFETWSTHVRRPLGAGDTIAVGLTEPPLGAAWKFCAAVLRADGVAAFDALDRSAAGQGSVFWTAVPFIAGPTAPTREPGEWRLALAAAAINIQGVLRADPPYAWLTADTAVGQLPVVLMLTASGGTSAPGPQTFTGVADASGPLQSSLSWWVALLTYRPWRPARGDFDGDGAADLVIEDAQGALWLWLMEGPSRLGAALLVVPPVEPGWRVEAADDFDGDGRADLVLRDATSGAVEFWLMDGAERQSAVALTTPVPAGYALAGSGDLTGDGRADLLWIDASSNRLVVWAMGADGGPRTEPAYELEIESPLPARPWQFGLVADMTGDGRPDLVWRNAASGQVVVWRMSEKAERLGGGYVTPPGPPGADWSLATAADRGFGSPDGAGLSSDLLWQNAATGELALWYMNPAGPPWARTALGTTLPAALPTGARVVGPR